MSHNDIIEHIYKNQRLKTHCKKFPNWEDLWHDFIEKINNISTLCRIYEKDYFDFWAMTTINNMARSARRSEKFMLSDIPDFADIPFESDPRLDCVVAAFEHIDWYDREIYKSWLKCRSARKLADATKIERRAILQTIKNVQTKIKCQCQ